MVFMKDSHWKAKTTTTHCELCGERALFLIPNGTWTCDEHMDSSLPVKYHWGTGLLLKTPEDSGTPQKELHPED